VSSFQKDFERWFSSGNRVNQPDSRKRRGSRKWLVVVAVVLLLLAVGGTVRNLFTEWLWFQSLGYQDVFTRILGARVLLFFAGALVFAALFAGNVVLASRLSPRGEAVGSAQTIIPFLRRFTRATVIALTAFFAFMFGLAAQASWEVVLRFQNGQPFGSSDPVFFKDAGFYVFTLPFLSLLRGWLMTAVVFTLIAVIVVYAVSYTSQRRAFDNSRTVLAHVGALAIAIALLAAGSYWLGIWDLVYSPRGTVAGASYTDMHAQLPAQWALFVTTLLLGCLILVALVRRKVKWAAYAVGFWIVLGIVVGQLVPGLVQRLQVEPNELELETPYIEYNIAATREAFGLNRIVVQDFAAQPMPTAADIAENDLTIQNIRLWDHRPLLDTYNQTQSIRLYYDFVDVDVDRYNVDGTYRQVMLAARELSKDRLPSAAQTWVNRTLQYTHGYGIAMSPVNEVNPESGLPILWVRDLPPSGVLPITQPQIYFGEKTNDFVIVGSGTQEFDYPVGDTNAYTTYEGADGVSIGSIFRRAIYAWEFNDFNVLISSQVSRDSKVLYHRNIRDRVSRIAPFLSLDTDPYIMVLDGRLTWVIDGYTTTTRYPYSQPLSDGTNYIRNSVKAIVDAYDGTVDFYASEPDDPILLTYQSIFPGLFKPMEAMPAEVKTHLRYPVDMFDIQSSVYRAYHMQDARVFYNKEDLWAIPNETYSGETQQIAPYYVIMRLPGEEREEFLLMLPFTPSNKNNAIGWLAARCDGDNYGRLLVYQFPKERLIYGPTQIENRIQQDTAITEQLALWSRGGSRVIRGNLLVIPIGESTIYVEGIFLQAETAGGLPELKRVIVAAGDEIAMRDTLAQCLTAIFGEGTTGVPETPTTPSTPGQEVPEDVRALIEQAQQQFARAQEYLQQGDWAGYGSELTALEATLAELARITG